MQVHIYIFLLIADFEISGFDSFIIKLCTYDSYWGVHMGLKGAKFKIFTILTGENHLKTVIIPKKIK